MATVSACVSRSRRVVVEGSATYGEWSSNGSVPAAVVLFEVVMLDPAIEFIETDIEGQELIGYGALTRSRPVA